LDVHLAVYLAIGAPPLFAGALNVTVSDPVATLVAFAAVGASGVPIVTAFVKPEAVPVPFAFTAATSNRYTFPFASPVTTSVIVGVLNARGD
jgi:hypothetical protein